MLRPLRTPEYPHSERASEHKRLARTIRGVRINSGSNEGAKLHDIELRLRLGVMFEYEERQMQKLLEARPDFLKSETAKVPAISKATASIFKYCSNITEYAEVFADNYQQVFDQIDEPNTTPFTTARMLKAGRTAVSVSKLLDEPEPKSREWLSGQSSVAHDGVIARLLDVEPTVYSIFIDGLYEGMDEIDRRDMANRWETVIEAAFTDANHDLHAASNWLLERNERP